MDARRRRYYAVGGFLIFALFLYLRSGPGDEAPLTSNSLPYGLIAANATLGFDAILAVSRKGSPRREDLTYAANLTGLQITIPDQPIWSDLDVEGLKAKKGSKITRGSALAWLGHLNALHYFLESDLQTALILEDDVDWDIHIRTVQMPLAARAFRELITTGGDGKNAQDAHKQKRRNGSAASDGGYWGVVPDDWEILYLGHCGDFMMQDTFDTLASLRYDDDTLPRRDRMHTKTSSFLNMLRVAPDQRVIHRSFWPLCTFGYAVTRASAARIAGEFAGGETEGEGCEAFDVRILEACRDFDWLCYSVNPELFHHIEAPSEIGKINDGKLDLGDGNSDGDGKVSGLQEMADGKGTADGKGGGAGSGIDNRGRLQRQSLEGTPNIACGARSRNFFTRDPETLKYLQGVVGEKGHCLMDQMEEDMSRWP